MDIADYKTLMEDALSRNETLVFACHCSIRYSGRAESELLWGDRLVVVKGDGCVLVHQPQGNNPVNYMKPGSSVNIANHKEGLQFNFQNIGQKEYLDVTVRAIYFFNSYLLNDSEKLTLAGTEKDMAEMLFKEPDLVEKGFVPFSMEEHTAFGFIDLFGTDIAGVLTVVECKRYTGDLSAVTQLRRYVEKIKTAKGVDKVRGILACPKISPNALAMLTEWGFSFVSVSPPKYLERYDQNQKKLFDY